MNIVAILALHQAFIHSMAEWHSKIGASAAMYCPVNGTSVLEASTNVLRENRHSFPHNSRDLVHEQR